MWQPIESAPKDKRILVWSEDGIFQAEWDIFAKKILVVTQPSVGVEWSGEDDAPLTHWMPCPQDP